MFSSLEPSLRGPDAMTDFLTTRELAELLRVKERKVYDLAAKGALPVRRVTGKLLFARADVAALMGTDADAAGTETPAAIDPDRPLPLILTGGHDPLLEWALRASGSGIAAFLDGALDGLRRASTGECIAAGLHIPEADGWNVGAVAARMGREPWVLVEWTKRKRGLVIGRDAPRRPRSLREARGLRVQARQATAGRELVRDRLVAAETMGRGALHVVPGVERSEIDLAQAIANGRADVGLGIAAAARQFDLDFEPLVEERFDLLVWRRAWFDPPFQTFLGFCRSPAFREKAAEMGGYDPSGLGTVHFNGA